MNIILPKGTLVNSLAVIAGSSIGLMSQNLISPELQDLIFKGIGLCVLILGIKSCLDFEGKAFLIILGGVLFGLIVSYNLSGLSLFNQIGGADNGLWEAFILFCTGSLTVFGTFEEGLEGKRDLLYTKSLMDGVSSIVLSVSFGIGVLYSVLPLFVFQTVLTNLAHRIKPWFDPLTMMVFETTGGMLIVVIGINMLGLAVIPTTLFLPALLIGPLLSKIYQYSQSI